MDYPLENLGPERFQVFCQSLLLREYPDLQCLPVAQPDGGRDAIVQFHPSSTKKRFAVFQVKYVRNPSAIDGREWIRAVLKDELPKIGKLIPKGAERYFLITNVPGTAHPDSGSIDKVQELIDLNLPVTGMCLWRDDVNRRLDSQWALKWTFPEVMSGPDFLRLVFETGIGEEIQRRRAAIRAFLQQQYQLDEEVRFKQVELQNKLLDLFIDVPAAVRVPSGSRRRSRGMRLLSRQSLESHSGPESEQVLELGWTPQQGTKPPGVASILLDAHLDSPIESVVLEGGPGQGKSTITQYLCQVHRIRLLGNSSAQSLLPEAYHDGPKRLPIRVDLRDFATWVSQGNPFLATEDSQAPPQWAPSMEAFLAALISHQSGGAAFSVDDLVAVSRVSSLLLVFDGLDEVADIGLRRQVVDEIVRGCQRLRANAAGLQVVVTSRPAAFANSPGMPEQQYTHLVLQSLSQELIVEYAEKWASARKLDSKLRSEFKHVLKQKLDQPHLRDLARNPMQLAIFLSLLLTRGASLPDKRTALYDSYMELFFNREAEKSPVVRENRELLIEIHRYLAWVLHSEAESGRARANISQERLLRLVSDYLCREEYDPGLTEKLFAGMVERVVALVSRVQGTYEFEVQPLREYFAASYLFHTAPLSTPGRERPGARPDRFDGISRNFYWLNVTRFYAGCYSKGELPSLVERIQDLCKEDGYSLIPDTRLLAATLLSDWVFAQNPRSVREIVKLVVDGVSLRRLVSSFPRRRLREGDLILPPGAGREEVAQRCFEILETFPPTDFVRDVV
jgi:hypothetical protein